MRVFSFAPARPNGAACSSASSCLSDFCTDGVCCESACGSGSSTDCQACSTPLTGAPAGQCRAVAAGTWCRHAVSAVCDVAERCDGTSLECPPDAFVATTAMCRAAIGPRDLEDYCTGTSPQCPEERMPAGTLCRAATAACDVAETCNGLSYACPADVTMCEPDAGPSMDASVAMRDGGSLDAATHDAREARDAEVPAEDSSVPSADASSGVDAGGAELDGAMLDGGRLFDAGDDGGDAEPDAARTDAELATSDGGAPAPSVGCACRVGRGAAPVSVAWLALALAALFGRLRRPGPAT